MAVVDNAQEAPPPRKKPKDRGYTLLCPRFWHGMTAGVWFRMLARNRFAVSPLKLHMVLAISFFTLINSVLRVVQERSYGKKAKNTPIKHPPLFIIGHWRSGTTFLHELLVLDKRHNYPTTYQCFAPSHFLVSEKYVRRWLGFVLPSRRPMDNMEAGWDKPQEEEFALCNLGMPSPYLGLAFPNRPPYPEYLTLETLTDAQIEEWKQSFFWFLKRINFGDPRQIILKSPPHTARIKLLLETFPDARFVHIARDPYDIFRSTMRLWESLNTLQGLQVARNDKLEAYIFDCFDRMYTRFEAERELIDPSRFYELRYEDLVADPVGQMRSIYGHHELGDFEQALPGIEAYLEDRKDYRTNRHEDLPAEIREKIATRWSRYLERYDYDAR